MLIKWYEKQIKDLNIEVRFNTEVKNIRSLDADEIVIATGAKARTLGTRGFEKTMEALVKIDLPAGVEINVTQSKK